MSDTSLSERHIVLGVTGSVAAYKACHLIRRLRDAGAEVRVVMTANAGRFVGEETMRALSGNRVISDLFVGGDEWVANHIELGRWADLLLIAPATANIIGKAASGIADDVLSTAILSARCKIVFAPAMNTAMYDNAIVQGNIEKLRGVGCEFVPPEPGALACGERGTGRLADVDAILETVQRILRQTR